VSPEKSIISSVGDELRALGDKKPYLDRFNQTHTHNTVIIDKNCASCMTGYAPQILSHIKLACISYVNQPVSYSCLKLSFEEIAQVKEYVLLQA